MYSVKDIAQLVDLSEHTIRFYADKGLIPSIKRDAHNHRVFDSKSLDWLIGVKNLKKCGMSIEDIKSYVDLCLAGTNTIHERYEIILKQKKIAEEEVLKAQQTLDYMEEKANNYLDVIQNLSPDNTNPATW